MLDIFTTNVPLWGVFTHLVVFVGGWYGHMKMGQQAQTLANQLIGVQAPTSPAASAASEAKKPS